MEHDGDEDQSIALHGILADGTSEDITESKDAIWNASEPTVATVTKRGMVSATKAGLVDISVEYKGEKAEEHFIVTP